MNEDPFGNFKKGNEFNDEKIINAKIIHISTLQRTARKKLTIVNGIPDDIDFDLVLRAWKKIFHCVGSVKYDPKIKENYIELNGDHRQEVYDFLIHEGIGSEEYIKMHGADN